MDKSKETSRRKTAGVNQNLDTKYEWPVGFGLPRRTMPQENEGDVIVSPPHEVPHGDDRGDGDDRHCPSEVSVRSVDLQRKRLALEMEKARQKIEDEKLENRLRLLEMEQELREAEINEAEGAERGSIVSRRFERIRTNPLEPEIRIIEHQDSRPSSPRLIGADYAENTNRNQRHRILEWVEQTQPEMQSEKARCEDTQNDIQLLCRTLSETIKTVAGQTSNEKLIARQTVEKDFPVFDGNPEEWPTFISQFRRISTLCNYSSEEMMIKLQKCLKGEAKYAVSGMMMSPDNVELVIKTLEMRFGRPDQIIDVLIDKVNSIPAVKDHNMEMLIQFSNHVRALVATIKSMDRRGQGHLQNPHLIKNMLSKLPDMLKLRWGEEIVKRGGYTDLEDMSLWLCEVANAACYVSTPTTKRARYGTDISRKRGHEATLLMTETSCSYCEEGKHGVANCKKLKEDDVDTRWKIATKRKLCFSCLRTNHQTFKCRVKRFCGINGCTRRHHKLLHKDSGQEEKSKEDKSYKSHFNQANPPTENVLTMGNGYRNVLLRMVKVKLYGCNGTHLETVALCDEASTVTLVDKSVAQQLGLHGSKQPLCIQWTNDMVSRHEDSMSVDISISGVMNAAKMFKMKNVRTVENLSLPLQDYTFKEWEKFPHLRGLPITNIHTPPKILIGQDNIRLTVARKVSQGPENLPIATKTSLGWILHGPIRNTKVSPEYSFHICQVTEKDEELHKLVKQAG